MATMFGLPMIKLGGLVVRTLTKPLAKVVKSRSKVHPGLNRVCHALGQGQHRVYIKFHMGFRGIQNYKIKDIPEDQAVEKGADLIGELLIFSVAVAVASYEYTRSSAKSKETERRAEELKRKAERELEERFEKLEMQVIWLEGKLAELGHIVEHDLDARIEEATGSAAVEQVENDLQRFESRRRRRRAAEASQSATTSPPSVRVGVELNESSLSVTASANGDNSATASSVWTVTYDAIAGLFR